MGKVLFHPVTSFFAPLDMDLKKKKLFHPHNSKKSIRNIRTSNHWAMVAHPDVLEANLIRHKLYWAGVRPHDLTIFGFKPSTSNHWAIAAPLQATAFKKFQNLLFLTKNLKTWEYKKTNKDVTLNFNLR